MNKNPMSIKQLEDRNNAIFDLLNENQDLHSHHLAPVLCTDLYQLTTAQAHFNQGTHEVRTAFDYYFRKSPYNKNSFAFSGGLEHLIHYINRLRFTKYQIEFLRSTKRFTDDFLDYLSNFRFKGNLYALEEGTLTGAEVRGAFIEGTVLENHLIESHLLNTMNSETNWLTLAVKLRHAAKEDRIWEGGLRRAQGIDASIEAARAGYLGGMAGTSNVEAGFRYGIPLVGTHPHAWIQFFDNEFDAFLAYYRTFPDNTSLLIDTYDVLKSGTPNAIKVAKIAESEGNRIKGVRIDSGDLAYLSREVRKMLDEAGLDYVNITASDSLNTRLISSIKQQGSAMSDWLVGTNYVTCQEQPALGGVFKLVAIEDQHGNKIKNPTQEQVKSVLISGYPNNLRIEHDIERWIPKIKISDNPEKVLLPGKKKIYRIIDNETNKHVSDYICLNDEVIDTNVPFKLVDPVHKFRKKTVVNYRVEELLKPIFLNGKQVYELKPLEEIKKYVSEQKSLLWEEQLREENPTPYYVNISEKLLALRDELIEKEREKVKF